MFEHEQVVDGSAAVEEMQAIPKLEEESPSEIMTLSSEVSLGIDQAKPPESERESSALEVQGEKLDEEVDKEELRSKRRSCSLKIIVGLLLFGFVLFIIIDTTTNGYVKDGIKEFLEWIEDHPIGGMFLFMVGTCMCRNNWCCRFVASAVGIVTNICTFIDFSILFCYYTLHPSIDSDSGRRFRFRRRVRSRRRYDPGFNISVYRSKPRCHCIISTRTLPAT